MFNEITILLTGTGAPGAPGIIKCLRNNGERNIRIVGVDMNEDAPGRRLVDSFYKVPAAKDPNFINCIFEVCRKENVHVIIPLVTRELSIFANNISNFENQGIRVAVTSLESLEIANNKGLLLKIMHKNKMFVPNFYIANSCDDVKLAFKKLGYPYKPIVVKPVLGNGSRGTRFINTNISRYDLFFNEKPNSYFISFEELISVLNERSEIPQIMVMEFLPGTEYSVDVLADHGNIVYCVCRKGINVVSSIMVDSVIVEDLYIFEICSKVVKILGLDGNIGFDLKENTEGRPCVMEINPRLAAGVVACAVAGVNLPYLRIKQLLGEELPQLKAKCGYIMQRRYNEVFFDENGDEIAW